MYRKPLRVLSVCAIGLAAGLGTPAMAYPADGQRQIEADRQIAQGRTRGLDHIEIRDRLRRQGYRRITDIRFISEVRNDHFTAIAWRNGVKYRLMINDDSGRVMRRWRVR